MRTILRSPAFTLGALAWITACTDLPSPTEAANKVPDAVDQTTPSTNAQSRIAVIGILEEMRGLTLIIRPEGPAAPHGASPGWVELALGKAGEQLAVLTYATTLIHVGGVAATVDALIPGMRLIASGTASDGALAAIRVSDLSGLAPPSQSVKSIIRSKLDNTNSQTRRRVPLDYKAQMLALCASQEFDYDVGADEFQGCWGGPSIARTFNNPDVPVLCPLLGCFVLEEVSYTLALAGWGFAFPYLFSATADLVYHVPGIVTLGLDALPATSGTFTFSGGLGVDFGFTFSFCWVVGGCDLLGTYHISPYSTAHQAAGEAPFSGAVMEIAEVGCPSIPVIPLIPGVLDMMGLGLCEDLSLRGAPFTASVKSGGAFPPANRIVEFDGLPRTIVMRPNAMSASVAFDQFEYIPALAMGFYFRVKAFGASLFETPSVAIHDGPFEAITTPFPRAGTGFSENIPHPTSRVIPLEVQRARAQLTFVSPSVIEQGTPVTARLVESYDGSPIGGATVTFRATGEGETLERSGQTGADGRVSFHLAAGQYTIVAGFAGTNFYLPVTSAEKVVTVYQATTFVICGGDNGGVHAGNRYLFWGSQWAKEITGNACTANASFKGYARQVNATTWESHPGNSGSPPAKLGRLISVIVTTRIERQGSRVLGNIDDWVILRVVDLSSYAPKPGHSASGVMLMRVAGVPE